METPKQMHDRLAAKKMIKENIEALGVPVYSEPPERYLHSDITTTEAWARLEAYAREDAQATAEAVKTGDFSTKGLRADLVVIDEVNAVSAYPSDLISKDDFGKMLNDEINAVPGPKCKTCEHAKSLHMLGDCGACDCEKFVAKAPYAPKPHLEQRLNDPRLVALRNQLNAEARGNGPVPKRRDNKRVNPKAKRQR